MPTAFDEEIKLLEKWKTKDPSVHRRFAEWRRKWKIMGPVAFAHEVLKVDPETGDPLTLSEDQKKWLLDVTKRGVRFTIIVAGRGCLAKGTLIQMEDGSYKPIEKIKMGDRVVSTDDGITTRIKTVVGVYNNGLKEVFLLKNSIGGKIIGTEDHLFLTNAKKKIIWQPLSYFKQSNSRMPKTIKLRIGSYDVKDYPISDSRIVFLAWLISEGNYTSTPKITNTNYACLKECEEIARNEFNVNPKYYSKGNGWDLICSNDFNKTRPRVGFRGSPKSKLIRWLEEIGIYGQKKEMKEIPNFLFKCSNRQIKLFLETFRLGDGNLYERKGKRKGQLLITLYAGLSLTLAKQLCLLFNRLGIYPNIKLHHGYEVYMADKKSRQYLNSKYDDVAYGLKKESLGKKEVWDIEVDSGLPCFLTNGGFFAHNSGKTFVLAVYVTWRIFTHEFWGISCMGGSAEQSEKIHKYVSYWVREQSELNSYCLKYTTKKISTYCDSYVRFLSCSETSVRGPHVVELIIDEQAAGEQRGGTKTMKAAIGQVSTSKDIHIHKSCYSGDTEILTENGWKLFKDLQKNEKVATLNPKTEEIEYRIPTRYIEDDYDGKMYYLHTSQINQLVTPNHKMFIKRKNWKAKWLPYYFDYAENIAGKCWYAYKKNGKWNGISKKTININGNEIKIEDWIDYFGFWIAEGWTNFNPPYGYISGVRNQNTEILSELKNKLERNGIHSFITKRTNQLLISNKSVYTYLKQFGKSYQKFIPKEIKNLDSKLLKKLLDSYLRGDGRIEKTRITATTASKQLRDDLQEIALKVGWSANYYKKDTSRECYIGKRKIFPRHLHWTISFIRKRNEPVVHATNNFDEWINYKGKIYCVEVPNHTVYVRRNGKPCWSGNSTAQFIQGDFIDTWNNAKKLGYKRYRWSIAKHKSGEDDPYRIYQDINPNNWISNVPWILDQNVKILRDNWSDDEWLVEALGGIGSASGLVFDPNDLTACICSRCLDENKPCKPYKNGYCPIIQYYMQLEGSPSDKIPLDTKKALRKIGRRTEGVDWGKKSPCAYTATGKYRRAVFVLHSEEEVIGGDADKIQKAIDIAEKWNIDVIRPDPREWAYNNAIAEKGFAVHQLFTGATGDVEKNKYLFVLKRLVERHLIIIPCIFEDLIRSLRSATYDDKGRIRKHKDHSLDSLIYAVSYYDEVSDQTAFWKAIRGEVIEEEMTEEEQETIKKQKEENVKRTGDEDIRIIDDWEEYVKKRKWKKEEEREGEGEFPWGEGADMW